MNADEANRQRFAAHYASIEGSEAIFVEYPSVCHVRVTWVEYDAWGVKVEFTDFLTPGMHRLSRNPCQVSAAWFAFSFSAVSWEARYVGWRLLFDPALIRDCARLAASANENVTTIALPDYFKVFSEWQKNLVVPGKQPPN